MVVAGLLCASCKDGVEVSFAEPLPVGKIDLAGFPKQFQGRYVQETDTSQGFVVQPRQLLHRQWQNLGWHQPVALDTLLQRQATTGDVRVAAMQGDSAQVWQLTTQVVFSLDSANRRLRRQGQDFYLSRPGELPDSWTVQRLRLAQNELELAVFTQDTLRLAVLDDLGIAVRETRREGATRYYLVQPTSARQSRQLLRHEGLWLTLTGNYHRHRAARL